MHQNVLQKNNTFSSKTKLLMDIFKVNMSDYITLSSPKSALRDVWCADQQGAVFPTN